MMIIKVGKPVNQSNYVTRESLDLYPFIQLYYTKEVMKYLGDNVYSFLWGNIK